MTMSTHTPATGSDNFAKQLGSNAAAAVDSLLQYNSNTSDDEMSQVTGNTVDYNTNDYKYMYDEYSENDYIATGDIVSKKINYNNNYTNYTNSNCSNLDTSNSLLLNNQMAMAMDGTTLMMMTTTTMTTATTTAMTEMTTTANARYGHDKTLASTTIGDPNYGCYVNGTIPLNDPLLSSTHLYTTPHEAAVNNIVLKQQQEIDPNEVYEEDYEDDVQITNIKRNESIVVTTHDLNSLSLMATSVSATAYNHSGIISVGSAGVIAYHQSATAAAYQTPYYNYQQDYFNEEDEYKYLEKEREEAHHDDGRPLDELNGDALGGKEAIEDEECESGDYSADFIESERYGLNRSNENGSGSMKSHIEHEPDDVLETAARNQHNKKRHLLAQESISDNDFFLQHFDGPGLKGLNKQETVIEELDETMSTANSTAITATATSDSLKSPIVRVPSTRISGATTMTATSTAIAGASTTPTAAAIVTSRPLSLLVAITTTASTTMGATTGKY